ncbi:hypothetical protein [Erwinia piriflorinigrans]|nr:hypothetical protein [Erwinia piriflorinigrans]
MKYPFYLCARLFVMMGLATAVHAADSNTVQVNIKANVTASCAISLSATEVTLDAIPAADFVGKNDGDTIGHPKNFKMTPTCYGSEHYSLTLTPMAATTTPCIKTSADFMRFCLTEDSKVIDFKDGKATLTKTLADGAITFTVTPQVGNHTGVTAGEVKGGVTLVIAPQ